ncbi:sugar O-acetyltransferase [Leptolyngbya sp. FACHB-321]|uniref:sugar O-acetyltransferase n=1 Tax=Leptolyngbya sp. FACHB-321 TaxID=2692807 RepID=UPI001685F2FB|nr:sugar O-acetyltransferase [Leptolyngbya sp. FACHB-321]MBD2035665.1 sugar O-acetyltransferase [Leptolyngbya sp. FACHB-321]
MSDTSKTEKQKMLAGELYLPINDAELVAESQRALRLLRLYNQTTETEGDKRIQTLRALFGAIGEKPQIVPPFHCDYGSHITIGDRFYMNYGGVILDCNKVHIGNDVLCAPYVQIYAAYHPTNPTVRLTGRELAAPIRIGNNVWIGGGAIICPGVTIGDNTTIGAGSVVTKDIPANVVAVGNPCRVLRSVDAPALE